MIRVFEELLWAVWLIGAIWTFIQIDRRFKSFQPRMFVYIFGGFASLLAWWIILPVMILLSAQDREVKK